MPQGFFFSDSTLQRQAPLPLFPKCGACKLYKTCLSPKMPVSGEGARKILLVGEAPGSEEDKHGIPFIGSSGTLLSSFLQDVGIDMRRDCWITNSLRCRPVNNEITNPRSIEYCRPFLIQAIKEHNPEIIIPLGAVAVKSLIGWLWKEDLGGINRWVDWKIPCQKLNAWICPVWHPAYLLYSERRLGKQDIVMRNLLRKQLREAVKPRRRPWKRTPDFFSALRLYVSQDEAVAAINQLKASGRPLAFDYETNMLKPDCKEARIVCCSISDGKTSIAYPWTKKTSLATKEVLHSDIPKIGYNLKFEDRWTRKEFGEGVRNWIWDGMIAAHVLDNRQAVTGLKFQSFVLLGMEDYDSHIKPLFSSNGSNSPNKIAEVELTQLLKYCAMDSLLEAKVAKIQMKKIGFSIEGDLS